MRLSDCLNNADISTLRRIAIRYNLTCTKHSKMSLHQAILMQFRQKDFLEVQLQKWTEGREIGHLRLCLEPNRPVSPEELAGWFQSDKSTLAEMLEEGWLFQTTRLGGGRTLYCVPDDLRDKLSRIVIHRFLGDVRTSSEGPLVYAEEQDMLLGDLDSFLQYTANHEVTLTQDGAMYKRFLEKTLGLMQVDEEPLSGGWRFGYGRRFHDYPDRFALIYDFAYSEHLVAETSNGLLSVGEEWDNWNQSSQLERHRKLASFYIFVYRRAIRRLPVIARLLTHTRDWIHVNDMFGAIDGLLSEYYYDTKENVWHVRILKMLRHLGIIRMGTDEFGEPWFQITKLGQQLLAQDVSDSAAPEGAGQQILIVQPNFDIVVTQDAPQITAELALFTDLKQSGALRIYRLSPSSAERAILAGTSGSDILKFLVRHAQTQVPGNVERTIQSWDHNRTQQDSISS
jgi:hypothetical protein